MSLRLVRTTTMIRKDMAKILGCILNYEFTGTQFDSSYDRGSPTTFAPNQVIKGWTEAMQLMVSLSYFNKVD